MGRTRTSLALTLITLLLIHIGLSVAQAQLVNINGSVAYNNTPVCALVLANGQYMFTCVDNLGQYDLAVPLDANGDITLFAFCSGLAPFKTKLMPTDSVDFDIEMVRPGFGGKEMELTVQTEEGTTNPNWVRIGGTVTNDHGIPLCAMVLVNGQSMFTCGDKIGEYDLEVPLDENNEITLYGFCSNMRVYKKVLVPNIVKDGTTDLEGKVSFIDSSEEIIISITDGNANPLEGIDVHFWDDLKDGFRYYIAEDPGDEYASSQRIDAFPMAESDQEYAKLQKGDPFDNEHDIEMSLEGTLPAVIQVFDGSDEFEAGNDAVEKIRGGDVVSYYLTPANLDEIDENVVGIIKKDENSAYSVESNGKIEDILLYASGGQPDFYLVYEGIPGGGNIETTILTLLPDSDLDGEPDYEDSKPYTCIDNDGDGYGIGRHCLGSDCDDDNANINPGLTGTCDGIGDPCDDSNHEHIDFIKLDQAVTQIQSHYYYLDSFIVRHCNDVIVEKYFNGYDAMTRHDLQSATKGSSG